MIESDVTKLSDGQPVAVLVVDDDPILRSTLAFEIRDAGYLVREASNTDEAEQILSTDTPPIDVVVTDIEMPGPRDGLALAKSVRAFKPHIKVIVASGMLPRTGVIGIADAFFGKPYDFTRILMRIKSLLQPPREADQP